MGVGALVEQAGARFKSDEKALAIIKQARIAIGGEQSLADVRSMIIKGDSTHTFKFDGGARTEQGQTEIAMQFPDKLSKMVKIEKHAGPGEAAMMNEKHDVIIMKNEAAGELSGVATDGGKKIIIKKIDDGNGEERVVTETKDGEFKTADGGTVVLRKADGPMVDKIVVGGPDKLERRVLDEKIEAEHAAMRQNELLRTTLSLLLTAPEGMDVSYTYGGETDVDGTACNLVNAEFAGSSVKLFISKASSLPVMMSYQGHSMPNMMFIRTQGPNGADPKEKTMTFTRKVGEPGSSEISVKFSDYRGVNGVQLPYKWTTSVAGQTTEVLDVTSYELNPANIAEKFQHQRTLLRVKKEAN
jgi:hypothetical protein